MAKNPLSAPADAFCDVLDSVRVDPATAMAGLFRPVRDRGRPVGVRISMDWAGWSLTFLCAEQLGADDLAILLGIVALCTHDRERSAIAAARTTSDAGRAARELVAPTGCLVDHDIVTITTTFYAIEKTAGWRPGHHSAAIQRALRRLASVTLIVSRGSGRWIEEGSTHLLGYAIRGNRICVTLNYRLSAAILGGQYAQLSLQEQRQLAGRGAEAARVLHLWLCAAIRPGQTRRLRLEALAAHAWPDPAPTPAARRLRLSRLRAVLARIAALPGWRVTRSGGTDVVAITRPPREAGDGGGIHTR